MRILLLLILVIALLPLSNIQSQHFLHEYELAKPTVQYFINATLFPKNYTLKTVLYVDVFNYKNSTFTTLYFHFYPNSKYFKHRGGKLLNFRVRHYKKELEFSFRGSDGSILEILLDKPLKFKDSYSLLIEYEVVLPNIKGRYGYYEGIFAIGNWYPILAVYDECWILNPYFPYGESFFSEVASYSVRIGVPKNYIVAATGELTRIKAYDDYVFYFWKAEYARDFAWTASKNYIIGKTTLSIGDKNIEIFSYVCKDSSKYLWKILTYASRTIKVYSELFGLYPYSVYRICEVYAEFAGMEYPALTMIANDVLSNDQLLEIVIAHETAHQWWYNVVGNDQANEPWLDEALAEYSQLLYIEYVYGYEKFLNLYHKYILNPYYSHLPRNTTPPTWSSVWRFKTNEEYYMMVYLRGAAFLHMLRNIIGYEKFLAGLRIYYNRFYFHNAKTNDLIMVFNEVTGQDLEWFFREWLTRSETPGFELAYAQAIPQNGRYILKIVIRQVNVTYPFKTFTPISISTSGGSLYKLAYVNDFENEIVLEVWEKPLTVELDPRDEFLCIKYKSMEIVDIPSEESFFTTYLISILAVFLTLLAMLFLVIKFRKYILESMEEHHANESNYVPD